MLVALMVLCRDVFTALQSENMVLYVCVCVCLCMYVYACIYELILMRTHYVNDFVQLTQIKINILINLSHSRT